MKTLGEFIAEKQHEFSHATGELTVLLPAIKPGAKIVRRDINKTEPADILGASSAENVQGGVQQKPDLFVNEKPKAALKARSIVASIAFEEEDEVVVFEGCEHAKYMVLMDPLDGSSNIDVNASAGTISFIYRRVTPVGTLVTEEDFLQPGSKQVAVGYMVYGSSTMLVYTTGCGVHVSIYDPSLGVFCLCQERMRFLEKGKIHFINERDYIKFPNGVKEYIRLCQEEDKSTNRPYILRYIGSLAADLHRNLSKGGVYLYPNTVSHPDGKLRLLYECNPMTFLAEQAGGKASDDKGRILDIIPETLHQRHPFFVGNDHMVEDVECFIHKFPGV